MKDRLKVCGLEFAEDKTRLIEYRKMCNRKQKETFDFLGFTHYCSKSNKNERFRVKRKTSKKKQRQKIKEFKIWIKANRNRPLSEIMETVKRKLTGHYNYYGITDNSKSINNYAFEVRKLLMKWLNKRSQKKSYDSEGFNQMLEWYKLPIPKIKVNIYAI